MHDIPKETQPPAQTLYLVPSTTPDRKCQPSYLKTTSKQLLTIDKAYNAVTNINLTNEFNNSWKMKTIYIYNSNKRAIREVSPNDQEKAFSTVHYGKLVSLD